MGRLLLSPGHVRIAYATHTINRAPATPHPIGTNTLSKYCFSCKKNDNKKDRNKKRCRPDNYHAAANVLLMNLLFEENQMEIFMFFQGAFTRDNK